MRGKSHGRGPNLCAWLIPTGVIGAVMGGLLAGPAMAAGPADVFYERALMSAANSRCNLFSPELAGALAASAAQARGAALRGGASLSDLAQVRARAQSRAAGLDCRSRDLAIAAGRVKTGFEGYARLPRMTYAGDVAGWRAERVRPSKGVSWAVAQDSRFGADTMTFGLAGPRDQPGAVAAVVRFADGARPYAARLLIRDPARAAQAYLGAMKPGASSKLPLALRTAPRNAVSVFLAEARAQADPALAPGDQPATLFRFPAQTAALMADLDPREAVTVEFAFAGRGGDVYRRAYVEIGDFAAARAFLSVR